MAIHKIGSLKLPNNQESYENKDPLDFLIRQGVKKGIGALSAGIGLPGDVLNAGQNLGNVIKGIGGFEQSPVKEYLPTSQTVKNAIKGTAGKVLPKGYLESEGIIDDFTDTLASDVPLWLASGGASGGLKAAAKSLGWLAGSNISGDTVKEMGGGPILQFLARLTPYAVRKGVQKGLFPSQVRKYAEKAEPILYKEAEKAGGFKVPADSYFNKLSKLYEKAELEPKTPGRSRIKAKIDDIIKDIDHNGQVEANRVFLRRKQFNKSSNTLGYESLEGEYDAAMAEIAREEVNELAKQYPEFGKPLKAADELHIALKAKSELSEQLEKNLQLKNFIDTSTPLKAVTNAATLGAQYPIKRGSFAYDLFSKSKILRDRWWQLSKEAVTSRNPATMLNILRKLKDDIDEEVKKDGNIHGNVRHISKKG